MKNSFVQQFSPNIKFKYSCFDRVILRGISCGCSFRPGGGQVSQIDGIQEALQWRHAPFDRQLNAHILKAAQAKKIPIHWWPSVNGGKDRAKQKFVQEQYARDDADKGDFLYCILTDKEPVRTFSCREFTSSPNGTSQNGKKYEKLYDCRKPIKQYYIYFHDQLLGGPCYLKISSYLPFQCEF